MALLARYSSSVAWLRLPAALCDHPEDYTTTRYIGGDAGSWRHGVTGLAVGQD